MANFELEFSLYYSTLDNLVIKISQHLLNINES